MGCYVYGYRDAHGILRYIGKGSGSRCTEHISLAKALNDGRRLGRASHFTRWLANCLREGKAFSCEKLLEGLTDEQAFAAEIELIATHKRLREGGTLYNTLEGGEGFTREDAKLISSSEAVRAKKSAAVRAALSKPEVKARLRAATKEANNRPHRIEQQRIKALAEWESPSRRQAAAQRARELWSDPVWSEQRRRELVSRNKSAKKILQGQ
jgi:hypothetical protein